MAWSMSNSGYVRTITGGPNSLDALRNVDTNTFCVWLYPDSGILKGTSDQTTPSTQESGILIQYIYASTIYSRVGVASIGNTRLEGGGRQANGDAATFVLTPYDTFVIDEWQHIAVVFRWSAGAILFYKNATLIQTSSVSAFNGTTTDLPSSSFAYGDLLGTTGNRGWSGIIDDPRIYRRELSVDELASIYHGRGRDRVRDCVHHHKPYGISSNDASTCYDSGSYRADFTRYDTVVYQPGNTYNKPRKRYT